MNRKFFISSVITLFLIVRVIALEQEPAEAIVPLKGLDPVALVEGKEIQGKKELSITRGRFNYLFANEKNKEKFAASPARYQIQHNGECMVMPGVKTNVEIFKVYNGKIYAFGTMLCRERFTLSPESFINPKSQAAFKPRNVAIFHLSRCRAARFCGTGGSLRCCHDD